MSDPTPFPAQPPPRKTPQRSSAALVLAVGAGVLGLAIVLRLACGGSDEDAAGEDARPEDDAAVELLDEGAAAGTPLVDVTAGGESAPDSAAEGNSPSGSPSAGSEGAEDRPAGEALDTSENAPAAGAERDDEDPDAVAPEAAGLGAETGSADLPAATEGAPEAPVADAEADSPASDGAADSPSPVPLAVDGSRAAEAQMTPEELLAAAKEAFAQGRYRDAYRLANRSNYQKPTAEALLLSGRAACELRDKELAKTAMKGFKRSDPERKTIKEACQRRGVRLGL